MECLNKHNVVHGGFIEIRENRRGREGWNLALIKPPDDIYGQWRLIETRLSPLTRRGTRHEPIATEAQLFADNLACHLDHAMHIYNLKEKTLEREDVLRIMEVFIPRS
jgi:hypothetical protein